MDTISNDRMAARFWRIFNRAMNTSLEPGHYEVASVGSWDSLKHVELMFGLEESFDIDISGEEIARLYSSTTEILRFLDRQVESADG